MTDTHNLHTAPASNVRAASAMVHGEGGGVRNGTGLSAANDGLGAFHRNPQDMDIGNRRNRVMGAVVVALMLGAACAYVYSTIPPEVVQAVPNSDLPRPAGPGDVPAMAPPPMLPDANVPAGDIAVPPASGAAQPAP